MALPNQTITPIPTTPKPAAVPSLWNERYDEIDENFDYLQSAVEGLQASINSLASLARRPGEIIWVASTTAPTGTLKADGSAVSVSTYAQLAAALYCGDGANATADWGYRCTVADGTGRSTTGSYIVLPDLRGEFARGWDDGRGVDDGRSLWAKQAGSIEAHQHDYDVADTSSTPGGNAAAGGTNSASDGTIHTLSEGGDETRPRNVALLACIVT